MSLLSEQSWTREYIKRLLVPSFDKKVEPDKRITVVADLEMFKKGEDAYVWAQNEGKIVQHYSIFWDGEFVSGFDADMSKEKVFLEFWKGFKEAYKTGRVTLTTEEQRKDYIVQQMINEENRKKAEENELKKLETTPEGKMAASIIRKLKKNGKKSIPTPAV